MATGAATVELAIGGMTCASCAARVERELNGLEGVTASVNYATEKARVAFPEGMDPHQLVAQVEAAGYAATLPHQPAADAGEDTGPDRPLRARLVVAVALSVPVAALAMVPPLRFAGWQWVALALTTPVVAWPFHRAALANLRHGAATMDTLISIGVLAAFGWSLYALVSGDGGHLYLEVATGVTTLILAGRYAEARARRRAGAALQALLELGAKDVAVVRDGREQRIPVEGLAVGDRFVVRPGEQLAGDGVVEEGTSAVDTSCSPGSRCRSRSGRATRSPGPRSTPAAACWSAPPGSAPTPSWPRWPGWSPRRSTARRPSNGSPTGSRRCSCRWCSCLPRPRWPGGSWRAPARRPRSAPR